MDRVQLKTTVNSAKWNGASKTWMVQKTTEGGEQNCEHFNAIMCCTGANQCRKMPLGEQLSMFKGEVLHSSDYQNNNHFAGKKVLVVGIGESAADIVSEISTVAAVTTAWSRRSVVYAARYPDFNLTQPEHDEAAVLKTSQDHCKVTDFLEYLTTTRIGNFGGVWQYGLLRQVIWRVAGSDKSNPQFVELSRASLEATNGHGARVFFQADQAVWVTKNSRMLREIVKGKVNYVVSPSLKAVGPNTIEFKDGKQLEVDIVMCCTGYQQDFNWLKEDIGLSTTVFSWRDLAPRKG